MKKILIPAFAALIAFVGGWHWGGAFLKSKLPVAESPSPRAPLDRHEEAVPGNSAATLAQFFAGFSKREHDLSDGQATLSSLRELPSATLRAASLRLLALEFQGLDPEEVVEFAKELTLEEQGDFLNPLVEAWRASQSVQSICLFLGEAGVTSSDPWLKGLSNLIQNNPAEAIDLVGRYYGGNPKGGVLMMESGAHMGYMEAGAPAIQRAILSQWATIDSAAAAAWYDWNGGIRLGRGTTVLPARAAEAHGSREMIASKWLESDPAAAIAWASADSAGGLLAGVVRRSPEEALALLDQFPDLLNRPKLPEAVAKEWARTDLEAAISWLEQTVSSPDRIHEAIGGMVSSISDRDTQCELINRLPEGTSGRLKAISSVARSWGEQGDEDAIAWAKSFGDPTEHKEAAFRIFWAWAVEDPDLLIKHRQELVDSGLFESEKGQVIMRRLAASSPELAKEWVGLLPEGLKRQAAIGTVERLARSSPEQAAQLVESMPDSSERADVTQHVVTHWTLADPEAAALWVTNLPEGVERDYAFGNLVNNWSRHDPAAAGEWLAAQAPSPARDRAAAEFVEITAWLDPVKAFQWAATIKDGSFQNEALRQALKPWARRDPGAASAAIEKLPVEPMVRKGLETVVDKEKR